MGININQQALVTYAANYAKNKCNDYFDDKTAINGEQILEFCGISQVNFFILKRLYDEWQREAANIRSPYFDYQNPEVKEALGRFLNFLSRHILVKREHFEPFVLKAITDTIELLLTPAEFAKKIFALTPEPIANQRVFEFQKYVKLNAGFFQILTSEVKSTGLEQLPLKQLEEIIDSISFNNDDFNSVFEILSEHQPIDIQLLTAKPENTSHVSSFFEQTFKQPDYLSSAQTGYTPTVNSGYTPKPLPTAPPVNTPSTPPPAPQPVKQPSYQPDDKQTFYDKLSANPDSKPTLLDKVQQNLGKDTTQRESLKRAFPIHEKFLFINELFSGDNIAWSIALSELDEASSKQSAIDIVKSKYASKFGWDWNSERVTEFIKVIENHFA